MNLLRCAAAVLNFIRSQILLQYPNPKILTGFLYIQVNREFTISTEVSRVLFQYPSY